MAYLWIISIGFVLSIGLAGGIFTYYLHMALNVKDAVKIDDLPEKG